jgi:hypothetical protein
VEQPGDSVRATIHLSDPIDPQQTQWVCYDEIRRMQNCSTATTMDESGLMVERNLVDGGDEDADGQAASGGNSGSCSIQSLFLKGLRCSGAMCGPRWVDGVGPALLSIQPLLERN